MSRNFRPEPWNRKEKNIERVKKEEAVKMVEGKLFENRLSSNITIRAIDIAVFKKSSWAKSFLVTISFNKPVSPIVLGEVLMNAIAKIEEKE